MATELICFRCVKVLGTKDPEHVKEVFECAGSAADNLERAEAACK